MDFYCDYYYFFDYSTIIMVNNYLWKLFHNNIIKMHLFIHLKDNMQNIKVKQYKNSFFEH